MTGTVLEIIAQFEAMSTQGNTANQKAPTTSVKVQDLINLFESPIKTHDEDAILGDDISSNRFEKTTSPVVEDSLPGISPEDGDMTVNRTEYDLAAPVGCESGNDVMIHLSSVQQRIAGYEKMACGDRAFVNEIQNEAEEEDGHETNDDQHAEVNFANPLFEKTASPVEEDSLPEFYSEDGATTVNRTAETYSTALAEYESESDMEILPNVDQTLRSQQDINISMENPFQLHVNKTASGTDGSNSASPKIKNKKSTLRFLLSNGHRRYKLKPEKKTAEKAKKDKKDKHVSLHGGVTAGGKNENAATSTKPTKRMSGLYSLIGCCLGYGKRNGKATPTAKCNQSTSVPGIPTSTIPVDITIPLAKEVELTEASVQIALSVTSAVVTLK